MPSRVTMRPLESLWQKVGPPDQSVAARHFPISCNLCLAKHMAQTAEDVQAAPF